MTLTEVEWLHFAVWWIRHPSRPCTDPRARHLIQDARTRALTTQDNEQDQ